MRNEDYDRELLAGVTLISAALIGVLSLFDATPSPARSVAQPSTHAEQTAQVRVIGTPFVPNTNPSIRLAND